MANDVGEGPRGSGGSFNMHEANLVYISASTQLKTRELCHRHLRDLKYPGTAGRNLSRKLVGGLLFDVEVHLSLHELA